MNRYLFSMLLAAVFGMAAFSPALAAEPETAAGAGGKFDRMDANKDGIVSPEEFSAFFPSMRETAFDAIDRSGDKAIDRQEWLDFSSGHDKDLRQSPNSGMGGKGSAMGTAMPKDMPPAMREALERNASGKPGPGAVRDGDSSDGSAGHGAKPGALLPGVKAQN